MTVRKLIEVDTTDRADGKIPVWSDADSTHVYGDPTTPAPHDPPTVVVMATIGSSPYTYTPPTGLHHIRVQLVGGGGASGSTALTAASQGAASGNGGGGEYAEAWIDAADLGATETVTLGAGGTHAAAGNNAGGNGGDSSFGALLTAKGGTGGAGSPSLAGPSGQSGGAGGTGGAGSATNKIHVDGGFGDNGFVAATGQPVHLGGGGAPPVLGKRGRVTTATTNAGGTGVGYGGGGSSAFAAPSQVAQIGGDGAPGACIVTEFYS